MNLLLAAASGYGKSYVTQSVTEENRDDYDAVVVLDYKDEYRGLVKAGMARYWQAGYREREHFDRDTWREMIEENGNIVLARHAGLEPEEWREVCATAIKAGRASNLNILWVVDEAHFVAPQRGAYPDAIKGLATTGRGEGQSAVWVSQRLTELDETIIAQCTARHLGGFESDNDTAKLEGVLNYPADLHLSGGHEIQASVPEALQVDGKAITVRKWTDDSGTVTGSEWIYSDDSGDVERWNSAEIDMESEHVGAPGKEIRKPV
ncbi:ATP-binding protein [Halobacteriales archaeon Cl-PHB]